MAESRPRLRVPSLRERKRLIRWISIAIGVGLVLVALPMIAELYVELRWFRSLGFEQIFSTILWTKIGVGTVVGLLFTAVIYTNLYTAKQLTRGTQGMVFQDPTGTTRLDISPLAGWLTMPVAGVAGLLVGIGAADYWDEWLKYANAESFGIRDPILGRDVSFYIFELPAYEAISSGLLTMLLLSLAACAALYVARGGLMMTPRGLRADRRARYHLSILGALVLLALAFDAWLAIPNLTYSQFGGGSGQGGTLSGAGYADVQARMPALWGQVALTIIGAAMVAISATRKRMILLIAGVALYLLAEIIGVRLYPWTVHKFSVVPNEAQKEAPYIRHNIEATRAAFGLGNVLERELGTEARLTREDVDDNQATIQNIRLWDHEPLLETFAQIQEIRTYYEFQSVDNDRYLIDGEVRQTMLSPRELLAESLPNRTWINEHFTFTHGYGITLGPVNTATPEGLPELFIQDIPPVSEASSFDVQRPEIYFGEMSNQYVFVRTANREFDYPQGDENVYTEYSGSAGVHLDGFITQLAVASYLSSAKLILSDDIDADSRVLLHRNIRNRVRRIAPFLRYDADPYLVLREDGSLSWIQDAYTTSSRYPYSQPIDGVNYVRNSVKVVVDAFNGTVDLYAADDEDPILTTWRRIFPDAFTPISEMPEDLRAHLRYPEDIFKLQTEIYSTYHMDRAELLYNREDQWEIPSVRRNESTTKMGPYYTIMRLPEEDDAEFILMLPFTPKRKANLAAWMVARMDGDHLGELVVYTFPKDRLVFGPQQVMNRIDQEEDISRQISLWDQRGSDAILGTLLVIPVEESLLYVVPLYLRASGGTIPELKRVIVVYENAIAMEETLDQAIDTLFGPTAGEPIAVADATIDDPDDPGDDDPPPDDGTDEPPVVDVSTTTEPVPEGLAARARVHYERAIERQRAGDWAGYGEELEQLGEVLQELAPATP